MVSATARARRVTRVGGASLARESGRSGYGEWLDTRTVLGERVRTSAEYWERKVCGRHPVMRGRESDVVHTLVSPEEVRESRSSAGVFLYYRRFGEYWMCVVVRHLGGEGYVITAYPTDAMKRGRRIWPR